MRGGMGLGDAIYHQSIARYFVGQGYRPEVCTAWPDVFRPLAGQVDLSPFRRDRIDRLAHYSTRRSVEVTTQFQDCCIQAGIVDPVDLWLDWTPVNDNLFGIRQTVRKPVVCVQMPRAPFGRTDGYGIELLPDCATIQRAIDVLKARGALIVQVGGGESLFRFTGIDIDLVGKTSVSDLLDVALACCGFLGYCSFIVPLAESMFKPALLIWSRAGLNSPHDLVRSITPKKIFFRRSSRFVMDDCADADLHEAVDVFFDQTTNSRAV